MSKLKKAPPTRIDEHDRALIALSSERLLRMQLQHAAAARHANELLVQGQAHEKKHAAAVADLHRRYALVDGDTVDLETGTITRAPVAAKPASTPKEG